MIALSYLAGVLDTNGAITMRTERGYTFPILRIGGKIEMLNLFAERFGGSVTRVPSRPNGSWTKQGIECKRVLGELRPHMILRLVEVDRCLAWVAMHPQKAAGPRKREERRRERIQTHPTAAAST